MSKRVVIIPGDDAAPEAMTLAVEILKQVASDLTLIECPTGEEGVKKYGSRSAFDQALREAIDQSDTTLFGSTNGTTAASLTCVGENKLMLMSVLRAGDQGSRVPSKTLKA